MRTTTILSLLLLAFLVVLSGCDQKKQPPKNGPVEYPPTWPLPTVTAMPGTTKGKPFFHSGFEIQGKESRWYMDNAVDTDSPTRIKWLLRFYYYGQPKDIYSHVESGLKESGLRWLPTSSRAFRNDKNGPSDKNYEILDNGKIFHLFVNYSGYVDTPYVEYCIVKLPGS